MTRARNSANLASHGNLFVDITNDRTGIGSVVPAQNLHVAGTAGFHGDVTFTGDNYNATWDRSDNSLKFVDNAVIKLGNNNDLSFSHDGTASRIQDSYGALFIGGNLIELKTANLGEIYLNCTANGAVSLRHNNVTKFATTAYGTNTTGTAVNDGLVVAGVATVTTMNVTGVLTYDDVTSVDSVGIVTARQGVHIDDSIVHIGDTNTKIRFPAADTISFETAGNESFRIDSIGRLLHGTTSSLIQDYRYRAQIQRAGSNSLDSGILGLYFTGSSNASAQNTPTAIGFHKKESDGSALSGGIGILRFNGHDGSNYIEAATIEARVDGNAGTNDMPGRITFSTTADGASSPTERLRIDSSGRVLIGTTTEGFAEADDLTINSADHGGITIRTPTNKEGNIAFSDTTSGTGEYSGLIRYRHSNNDLGLWTNSNLRLLIDSAGNMSLGKGSAASTNYTTNFQIHSSNATGAALHLTNNTSGSGNGDGFHLVLQGHIYHWLREDAHQVFGTQGVERMRLLSGGNLLIGTTSDSTQKLTLYGTNAAVITQNGSTGTGANNGFYLGNGNSTIAYVWNYENDSMRFATNNTERLRIDSAGAVLINGTDKNTVHTNADDVIIGNTSASVMGLSLVTSTSGYATLQFSDGGGNKNQGQIAYNHADDSMALTTAEDVRLRILSDGKVLIGHNTNIFNYKLAVFGTDGGNSGISASRFSNNPSPSSLILSKSRGTSIGSYTIVQNNDEVGMIDFRGADGSDNMSKVAEIKASIDGTPGSNDMPGRLTFHTTADGANSTTERLRITSTGRISVGANNQSYGRLQVNQTSDDDEAGFAVLNSGAGRSLRIYCDSSNNAVFNSGNAGTGQINFNEGKVVLDSSGRLLVNGASSNNAFSGGDDLIIGNSSGSTRSGITIVSNSSQDGGLYFSDGTSSGNAHVVGQIVYEHNGDYMRFYTDVNERLRIDANGRLTLYNSEGIKLSAKTSSLYAIDASLSFYATNNAVYLNGAGASGWLRLSAAGTANNRTAINLYGHSYSSSDRIDFRTNSTERMRIDSDGRIKLFPAGESGGAQGTPLYLQVQTNVTAINTPTGGTDQTGMFRIEERGSNNNRFHGIELRNRNSGDIRILNKDIGVSNGAVLVFAVDDNGQFDGSGTIRQYLQINGQGQTSAITLSGSYHVVASARDGSTSARAAASAWEIKKTLGPAARTGYYYLKNPYDGTTSQWWCDMETDGGGWVLIAHVGEGNMSDQGTSGQHWWSRSHKGGFDTVGAGYYAGGGYWRQSNGAWGENTNGQLMWDVRTHYSKTHDKSNDKVVFNWGTDQAIPSGNSGQSNIPNASNRRFNEWCYSVENAAGFNPMNYDNNIRSNKINGQNHFTEHMLMTWSFRGTGGNADNGESGPYWQIGSHAAGLHQHYEESLSGDAHGDGSYGVVSNEDSTWGGGGTNNGYDRLARDASSGTCNVWLR